MTDFVDAFAKPDAAPDASSTPSDVPNIPRPTARSAEPAFIDAFADPSTIQRPKPSSTLGDLWQQAKGTATSATGEILRGAADVGQRLNEAIPVGRTIDEAIGLTPEKTRATGESLEKKGEGISANVSPEFAAATNKGLLDEGGLTPTNIASKAVTSVASMAPAIGAGLINPAIGVGAFGLQGEAGGRKAGEQQVANLSEEQIAAVPRYQELIKSGVTPADARAQLSQEVADRQAGVQGAFGAALGLVGRVPGVSTLGEGIANTIARPTARALGDTAGKFVADRVGAGAAEGVGFAGLNAAGQVLGNVTNPVPTDATEGVAEAAASGLAPGFVLGAAHGIHRPVPTTRFPDAAPGTMADAANVIPDRPAAGPISRAAEQVTPVHQAEVGAARADFVGDAQGGVRDTRAGAEEVPQAAPPIPPNVPWIDQATGEHRQPTENELKDEWHRMFDASSQAGKSTAPAASRMLSEEWGVDPDLNRQMRTAAMAERKAGFRPGDARTEPPTEEASRTGDSGNAQATAEAAPAEEGAKQSAEPLPEIPRAQAGKESPTEASPKLESSSAPDTRAAQPDQNKVEHEPPTPEDQTPPDQKGGNGESGSSADATTTDVSKAKQANDERVAALKPRVDALTDDQARAALDEIGVKPEGKQSAREALFEQHPDDIEQALKTVEPKLDTPTKPTAGESDGTVAHAERGVDAGGNGGKVATAAGADEGTARTPQDLTDKVAPGARVTVAEGDHAGRSGTVTRAGEMSARVQFDDGTAAAVKPQALRTAAPKLSEAESREVQRQRIVAGDRIDPADVHALLGDKPLGRKEALQALRDLKKDQTVPADDLASVPSKRVGKTQKFDPMDVARAARLEPEKPTVDTAARARGAGKGSQAHPDRGSEQSESLVKEPPETTPVGVVSASDAASSSKRIAAAEAAGVALSVKDKADITDALARSADLRKQANRAAGNQDPMNKGSAFPLGVGFTKMTKRKAQAIDASVRRAGDAVKLYKRAESAEKHAAALLEGKGTESTKERAAANRAKYQADIVRKIVAGEPIKFGGFEVSRITRTKDGYPSAFIVKGEGMIPGVNDRFDLTKEVFGGDKQALRDAYDRAQQETKNATALVDSAARESAAHPENNLPEPSPAQHEANNYKQGHINLHGLDVTIQVPKGGMRRGTDRFGKEWEHPASDHYGHIRGTDGGDGEPHDVYLGPHAEDPNAKVFVIDQMKPGTKAFDEKKAMIGYARGRDARVAYEANFPNGLKTFGGMKEMSLDQFKESLKPKPKPEPLPPAVKGVRESKATLARRVEEAATARRSETAGQFDTEPSGANQLSEAHFHQIDTAVGEATKDWGTNAPRVRVLRSADELPASAMRTEPARYQYARGYYDGKTAYIVARNIKDIDRALRTVVHEVVGHHGIEKIIDQHVKGGWDRLVADVQRLRDDETLGSKAMRDTINEVERRYRNPDPKTFTSELLAVMAENGVKNGILDRAVAALRAWVREMFPNLKFSEADLHGLLRKSADFIHTDDVAGDARRAAVGALAFNRADPTDSAAFKKYFEGSEVVDAAGKPKILYHGTGEDFTVFDKDRLGENTGHETAPLGHFLTESKAEAQKYAEKAADGVPAYERVIGAYASIKDPAIMSKEQFLSIESAAEARAMRNWLERQGYDGIRLDLDNGKRQWIAFDSGQIKDVDNRGTFDRKNPDIRFSMPDDRDEGLARATGVPRAAGETASLWRNDQPLKRDVDYRAAKAGDGEAAIRLVDRNAAPLAEQAKQRWGSDVTFVAPHAEEATGKNAIPQTLAAYLAAHTGGDVDREIVQTNRTFHTGADAMQRLLARSEFDGPVEKGKKYVLVDDVTTMGSTLADLAHYIQSKGGEVVGTSTLVNAAREGGTLHADPALLKQIERRYGDAIREEFGVEPAALTASEARYLIGFRSADELRDRAAAARQARSERLGAKGIRLEDGQASGVDWPSSEFTDALDRFRSEAPAATPEEAARNARAESAIKKDLKHEANTKDRAEDKGWFSMPDQGGHAPEDFGKPQASVDRLNEVLGKPDDGMWQRAKDWMRGKAEDFRPAALGALQTRHVLELMEDHPALKGAKQYGDLMQQLATDRNQLMAGSPDAAEHPQNMIKRGGAAIAEDLRKYSYEKGLPGMMGRRRPEAKQLADVMHDATIYGLDPSVSYSKLTFEDSRGEPVEWSKQGIKDRIKEIRNQMRGRPGDDKSMMMDEVKRLRNLPKREKLREERWPDLVARYGALPEEGKRLYQETRDWYSQMRDETEKGLISRIDSMSGDLGEHYTRTMKDRIRLQFEQMRREGVYFPLNRDGDFWVSFTDREGRQGFKMFESAKDASQAEKKLRDAGFFIDAQGRRDSDFKAKNAPSGTFVSEIIGILKKAHAPEKVQDDIYQLFLKTLPEMSMRKHSIHRENVPGFSDDALRAFAKNSFHGAHQLARLRYAHQMQGVIDGMEMSMDSYRRGSEFGGSSTSSALDVARGDSLLRELKMRHDFIMSPKDTALANKANSIGFLYHLGASPASALVNLTQNAQITLPALAAQHGWGKATSVLGAGVRDALRTFGNIDRTLTDPIERQAYNTLRARGDIDKTQTHTLAGLAEGNLLQSSPAWAKSMSAIGYMFHKAEVINRESAGMAAFRLEYGKTKDFNKSVQYASDIINGTHFDYSAANRPRMMQNNVARIALQFKNYSIGMTWAMYRNLYQSFKGETPEVRSVARRTLTGILGMTGLMAGTMGLPIINAMRFAGNAAHTLFGDDEPFDFNTEYRAWLAENLGDTAAKYIADGPIDQLTGATVSNRVSLSNLWFQDADRELEGKDAYYQMLDSIVGPLGGMVKNFYVGSKMVGDGQVERGIETMMPKFAKDAMKSLRFAHEGANTLRGDPIVPDITKPEALIQALGFSPSRLFEQQQQNSALMNYQQQITDRRKLLMNAYALAVRSGADTDAAMAKIHQFNQTYPEIAIKSDSIRQSLRARARYSDEQQGGIALNKKLAPRLREEVGAGAGASP